MKNQITLWARRASEAASLEGGAARWRHCCFQAVCGQRVVQTWLSAQWKPRVGRTPRQYLPSVPGTSAGDQGMEPAEHCFRGWAGSEQPGLPPLTGFLPVEALPGRDISVVSKGSSCPPASVSLVHVGTFSLSGVFK